MKVTLSLLHRNPFFIGILYDDGALKQMPLPNVSEGWSQSEEMTPSPELTLKRSSDCIKK